MTSMNDSKAPPCKAEQGHKTHTELSPGTSPSKKIMNVFHQFLLTQGLKSSNNFVPKKAEPVTVIKI